MTSLMRAMVLTAAGQPLALQELPVPTPAEDQVLIKIGACGVCRTDLHVVDGELTRPKLPLVPGHEIVGQVVAPGSSVSALAKGQRVGVPWLGQTCGRCSFCEAGAENLCDAAKFTGYDLDGGYAEYAVANQRYCFPLPEQDSDAAVAPLLCAGLIGYRSLCMAGEGRRVGLYGFGAAAHILAQVLSYQGREVYAFTRQGDTASQDFARSLGAVWAGESGSRAPVMLDAAIIFAPVGELVPAALRNLRKGGVVVCAGIHMSDIPAFPYELLWGERVIRSVANLTRGDGEAFFELAAKAGVKAEVQTFALDEANEALRRLREGELNGAAVLVP